MAQANSFITVFYHSFKMHLGKNYKFSEKGKEQNRSESSGVSFSAFLFRASQLIIELAVAGCTPFPYYWPAVLGVPEKRRLGLHHRSCHLHGRTEHIRKQFTHGKLSNLHEEYFWFSMLLWFLLWLATFIF